jgi:hypothetical protein
MKRTDTPDKSLSGLSSYSFKDTTAKLLKACCPGRTRHDETKLWLVRFGLYRPLLKVQRARWRRLVLALCETV